MNIKKLIYFYFVRHRLALAANWYRELAFKTRRSTIEDFQVGEFNRIWEDAYKNVPFYIEWKHKYKLPERISSLKELDCWPTLSKSDLRNQSLFERSDCHKPNNIIKTGGSTGEPVRMPAYPDFWTGVSQVIGRRRYGLEPGDRILLLWGHEHLYGKGLRRLLNNVKRRMKDWISGWKRVSAYDLSEEAMWRAFDKFISFRPDGILGFSPAVLSFVRHNKRKRAIVEHIPYVKTVICSAGPLSAAEKKEISDFFHAPVCMEYGSVECGVMAYTRPDDGAYDVFWNTHIIQAQRDENGLYRNLVTRLKKCYIPLIRYDIGDYLELETDSRETSSANVLRFREVKGRPSEMISFKSGVSFFGALIGDCVKQVNKITASQIAYSAENDYLVVRVVAMNEVTLEDKSLIKRRICDTVNCADKLRIDIVQVSRLHMTSGGKVPRVVTL